jgi:hypothetical protein
MNKQEYISLRKQNNFTMIAFNYYVDKGGVLDYNVFSQLFQFNGLAHSLKRPLLSYLDSKFELTLIVKDRVVIGIV